MERVVCYCRVSTEEEKQLNALDSQIEELECFIKSNVDWELVGTYVDEGKTGTTVKNRKSYQELYEDMETDKFTIVVIKDHSRLNRNTLEWFLFINRIQKNNKRLFMYLDNQFYSPDNFLINGIKAMIAEDYSRELSRKLKSAAHRSQKKGKVFGNGLIYGYVQCKGVLTVDEEQAEFVRSIFEMYAEGYGCRKIQRILYEKGARTRNGTPINTSTISNILKNEEYKGTYVGHKTDMNFETKYNRKTDVGERIIIENVIPRIISDELWDKCARIRQGRREVYDNHRENNTTDHSNYRGKFLLSNKLFCGNCGKPMWHAHIRGSKEKNDSIIDGPIGRRSCWYCKNYSAYGRSSSAGCSPNRVYTGEMLSCLKSVLAEIADDDISAEVDNVFEVVKKTLKSNSSKNNLDKLKRELAALNGKADKLLDMCLDGIITKENFSKKNEALKAKIADVESKIADITSGSSLAMSQEKRIEEIRKALDYIKCGDVAIDDILIERIVKQIIVTDDGSGNHSAEIVLDFNETPNVTLDTPKIRLFETTYPFQKYHCVHTMEDWKISVSVI